MLKSPAGIMIAAIEAIRGILLCFAGHDGNGESFDRGSCCQVGSS